MGLNPHATVKVYAVRSGGLDVVTEFDPWGAR